MRGGGTSQAGQAIGDGIQIDISKYYNRVLEVNAEERWVRVEPGIVLDELNAQLQPLGMRFAPDISTASRATIGGMMANNSSGARSVLYGKTIDHVLEQVVVLSDGSIVALPRDSAQRCARRRHARSRLLPDGAAAGAPNTRTRSTGAIRRSCAAWAATTWTNSSIPAKPVNLAKIMVGSEGTLGVVLEAKLRLVPLPKAKAVMVIDVRRPAGSARRRAGDPAPQALGGRSDGQIHPRPHAAEREPRPHSQHVHRGRSGRDACASSSTPIARKICRRACRRSKKICARGSLGYRYHAETDLAGAGAHLEPARSGAGPFDGDEGRRQIDLVRRGHGGRAGEAARFHRTLPRRSSTATGPPPGSTRTPRSDACTCGR